MEVSGDVDSSGLPSPGTGSQAAVGRSARPPTTVGLLAGAWAVTAGIAAGETAVVPPLRPIPATTTAAGDALEIFVDCAIGECRAVAATYATDVSATVGLRIFGAVFTSIKDGNPNKDDK